MYAAAGASLVSCPGEAAAASARGESLLCAGLLQCCVDMRSKVGLCGLLEWGLLNRDSCADTRDSSVDEVLSWQMPSACRKPWEARWQADWEKREDGRASSGGFGRGVQTLCRLFWGNTSITSPSAFRIGDAGILIVRCESTVGEMLALGLSKPVLAVRSSASANTHHTNLPLAIRFRDNEKQFNN
jgi:hypothetical protein